jgi:transmembrane sensor
MKNDLYSRSAPVSEQAAAWFLAFSSGEVDEAGRRRFVKWLKSAPANIQEFLAIAALDLEVSRSPRLDATIDELIADARANVVVLDEAAATAEAAVGPEPAAGRQMTRQARWAIAATVLLGLAVTLWFVLAPGSYDHEYRTARGEQRSITLEDGSLVVLNTLSEIRVEYTGSSRRTVLVAGEALFDVEKDPDRPFTVEAGPLAIRVTGTRFNIYRQDARTVLTVMEGEVEAGTAAMPGVHATAAAPADADREPPATVAEPVSAAPETVTVTAGEQVAVAADGSIARDADPNLDRATAWTQRRLVFDNETLARVSEEFNRYNQRPVVIEDPTCANRRITGVFNTTDSRTLVAFLEGQPGIRVRREQDAIRVSGTPGVAP